MSTLGNTSSAGTFVDQNNTGTIVMSGSFLSAGDATSVGSGWLYIVGLTGSGTRSQRVRLAIFGDNGAGAPTTSLVGVTDEITISDLTSFAGTFARLANWTNFGGAPAIAPNTKYWVGPWWGTQVAAAQIQLAYDMSAVNPQVFNTATTYSSTANPVVSSWTVGPTNNEYACYFDVAASPVGAFQ